MTRGWRGPALLTVAVAAIAVPAGAGLASGGGVESADRPSGSAPGQVAPASRAFAPSPEARAQLDDALNCMADHGFGASAEGGDRRLFMSREETQSDEFRAAARECELPTPPTDAEIRAWGYADAKARSER